MAKTSFPKTKSNLFNMKKFSNITNTKIGQEPEKKEVKLNEEDTFRMKVIALMDNYLKVQTYGPINRYLVQGSFKITGKEMFSEALLSLMTDKSLKEQTAILESLKTSIGDWESIDEKINQLNTKIDEANSKNAMTPHRHKLTALYEKYSKDDELLLVMAENSSNKIKTAEKAHLRALTAECMAQEGKYPKELFIQISEKYKERANHLTNNK